MEKGGMRQKSVPSNRELHGLRTCAPVTVHRTTIVVHYMGWNESFDEEISISSTRIAKHRSHTQPKQRKSDTRSGPKKSVVPITKPTFYQAKAGKNLAADVLR